MLRRWRNRLHAVIGTDGATVRLARRHVRGWRDLVDERVACEPSATDAAGPLRALDEVLRAVSAAGHVIAGLRCEVTIEDALVLYDVIDSDLDQLSRRAADAAVGAALADTAGLAPNEIAVRWQRRGSRSIACAVPASTLQALQGILQRHRVRLGSMVGQFPRAYNARRPALARGEAVLAVARAGGTQLALIIDGGLTATRFEPRIHAAATAHHRGDALMLSRGYSPAATTGYHADDDGAWGDEAAPWRRQVPRPDWRARLRARGRPPALELDLSPTRAHVRPASWALLVAGAMVLAVSGIQFQTASGQHLRAAQALGALEDALAQARGGRNGSARQHSGELRAASSAMRELQVPWAQLFAAFEAASTGDVALMAVEPSAAKREVRIVAEAKSAGAMLDFLDALSRQPLRRVSLVSHQVQSNAPGTPVRFQARATWDAQ